MNAHYVQSHIYGYIHITLFNVRLGTYHEIMHFHSAHSAFADGHPDQKYVPMLSIYS